MSIQEKIKEITDKIVKEYKPEKIILFGSWACGKPGLDSDVDLFIVKEISGSTRELARQIDKSLFWRDVALDLIVDKPKHIKERIQLGDPFFVKIINQGKILYESK